MKQIEKTVFISYRRINIPWALSIYQNLTHHGFDVFFDYRGIASGNFEHAILENIKARAHFLVLLTPSALERCDDPSDWLRREIETALDTQRNIVPLMLEGFDFNTPAISSHLTGKLATLQHYSGLSVPGEYFDAAMGRLREEFLRVPLDAVLHPTSATAQQAAKDEQVAANIASEELKQKAEEKAKREADEKAKRDAEEKAKYEAEDKAKYEVGDTANKDPKSTEFIKIGTLILVILFIIGLGVFFLQLTSTKNEHYSTDDPKPKVYSTDDPKPQVLSDSDPGLLEMVTIKGDCFQMGSSDNETNRGTDEQLHRVCVESFRLMPHEVTRGQFKAFVNATGYRTDAEKNAGGAEGCFVDKTGDGDWAYASGFNWKDPNYSQNDSHPVVCVSYNDATAYAEWASRKTGKHLRLPTEAEWEFAARAKSESAFYWGNDSNYQQLCDYANGADKALKRKYPHWKWNTANCDDATVYTAPKKRYKPNDYGLYDMSGNVWEWTCSDYSESYDGAEQSCSTGGEKRSLRGGSWYDAPSYLRSATRNWLTPANRNFNIGFRLAQDL